MAAIRLKMPLILSGKRGHGAGGIAFDSKRYILQVFLSSDLEDYSADGKQPIINLREHFEIQGKKYNLIVYTVQMGR